MVVGSGKIPEGSGKVKEVSVATTSAEPESEEYHDSSDNMPELGGHEL